MKRSNFDDAMSEVERITDEVQTYTELAATIKALINAFKEFIANYLSSLMGA